MGTARTPVTARTIATTMLRIRRQRLLIGVLPSVRNVGDPVFASYVVCVFILVSFGTFTAVQVAKLVSGVKPNNLLPRLLTPPKKASAGRRRFRNQRKTGRSDLL